MIHSASREAIILSSDEMGALKTPQDVWPEAQASDLWERAQICRKTWFRQFCGATVGLQIEEVATVDAADADHYYVVADAIRTQLEPYAPTPQALAAEANVVAGLEAMLREAAGE